MLWFEQEYVSFEAVTLRDHEWSRHRRAVTRRMVFVACVAVLVLAVFQLLFIYDL
ncbi:hypothetical protein GO013_16005 [Pseudodesulfovibrio sp. JC047]|uniref:hypothetical protein n=1 Tax=Pseudodesulfovibrio sp. JC047 TaxID=2683199 RepID=UPI0013D0E1D0|nr:hypothetical protein [Pseudodesulfovibrio sp. JC047]NDV20915.1 hypothetical protein [Pseudodesulfovibrio sp. JC047]